MTTTSSPRRPATPTPPSAPSAPSAPCPRCACTRSHRWGTFSNRQRFRCLGCRRTFSTFTGTALHYLKRVDRWDEFCLSMRRLETVRHAAARLGIHRDTAFRWRHRFLATLDHDESVLLAGEVTAGLTWFRYTRKGARQPDPGRSAGDLQAWVALARDQHGAAISSVTIAGGVGVVHLVEALTGRITSGAVLRSREGPYSRAAICARRMGLRFAPLSRPGNVGAEPEPIAFYGLRIRKWMRRFRGVATKYLPHYLVWFRAADAGWRTERWNWSAVAPAVPQRVDGRR